MFYFFIIGIWIVQFDSNIMFGKFMLNLEEVKTMNPFPLRDGKSVT